MTGLLCGLRSLQQAFFVVQGRCLVQKPAGFPQVCRLMWKTGGISILRAAGRILLEQAARPLVQEAQNPERETAPGFEAVMLNIH
nr:hypothetical protein [uncultured Flavonifractor sp.]